MGISPTALDGMIKDALTTYNNGAYQNERDRPQHLKILGDTMKGYFEDNIEITYTWSATLPPPASSTDPVTSFSSTVFFPSFDLTPSRNLDDLASRIRSAFAGAVINHASGFAVAPGSFLVTAPPTLGRVTSMEGADTAIYVCVVIPICTWVLTLTNPAPLLGTHGTFVGATTGMLIA